MKRAGASIVVLASLALGAWVARSSTAPEPSATRSAIEKSLPYLEREGLAWLEGRVSIQHGQACVSCHHVAFAVWSHHEAEHAGIATPAERIADLERRALAFVAEPRQGQAVVAMQLLLGHGRGEPPADLLSRLVEKQQGDGSWRAGGQFPTQLRPEAESGAVATMWALLAQSSSGAPDSKTLVSRKRAVAWLAQSPRRPGPEAGDNVC